MIPYVTQPSFSIGPVTIHAFGLILATAVVVGDQMLRRRVRRLGLSEQTASAMGWYALVFGLVFAHLFALVLYFPEKLIRDPLSILKFWEDVSSFGGMIGGVVGAVVFLRVKGAAMTNRERWGYLDAAAYVLPFAWAIGRIGCALAHDHPGSITTFPLAVSLTEPEAQRFISGIYASASLPLPEVDLSKAGFHDLGWYEFLYLSGIAVPLFLMINRRTATGRPGYWAAVFCLTYAPMRIGLDAFRVADKRYFGLTPGQLVALVMLGLGIMILRRRPAEEPSPAVS